MNDQAGKSEVAKMEEEILEFWKKENIFKKTLEKESPRGEFVFYEGPPTANGMPGIHHLESRAFKDAVPRYRTMRGYHVRRKAGWDTHGLPVELQMEKKLGLKSKKEIEEYGIAAFNKACKESVLEYVDEWDKFTKRIAYWVDQDEAYYTFNTSYIESLWSIVGEIDKKGLLYKDYKVVPWCPRCGTALSSHELGQPEAYVDVKDLSVTAKFELTDEPGTYVLAWTTTPWTLPGNVGLAVGEDIEYVKILKDGSTYILAKERLATYEKDFEGSEILGTFKGKDLVGKSYKPLFGYFKDIAVEKGIENLENAYKVYEADFVTTEDGTGVVHTAVMYGQEDFELGSKVGLPKMHVVDDTGHFIEGLEGLSGAFVKDPETDVAIIKLLAAKGLLFAKQKYEHSYPHCWRCKTPLLYYARDSWYVRISNLKDTLVSENEGINWEPAHIKEGRFGEWLKGIKDWAISRERYWGTPLPVWINEEGERLIVDSIETLRTHSSTPITKVFFARHGESEKNIENVFDCTENTYPLTEKGKEQAYALATSLKESGVTKIYASPIRRARETAEIVAEALNVPIEFLDDLKDVHSGEWEGLTKDERGAREDGKAYAALPYEDYLKAKRGTTGESWLEYEERNTRALEKVLEENKGSNVLIVGHQGLAAYSSKYLRNLSYEAVGPLYQQKMCLSHAVATPIYINAETNKELDLHRPFIDAFVLTRDGKTYKRVNEVMDVWFDSGAMPFAQDHYPFENKDWVENHGFPGDYISEAIDQTRGWFYTLHAVGNLLGKGKAYKNVICLGHLLDAEGKKMSKSLGNVVNPWEAMEKWGADTLRFWMYSITGPGDSKNFDPKTVDEVQRKVFNLLRNIVSFYEMYKSEGREETESTHVLDQWIISLLNTLVEDVTNALEQYDLTSATRSIRDFVGDFSQWYIRRTRDRFKEDLAAQETTRVVLHIVSRLLAPFAPFASEEIFQKVRTENDPESVHLSSWPEAGEVHKEILEDMQSVRSIVSRSLEARDKAGVKVRQPLATLNIPEVTWKDNESLLEILRDEVNVKNIEVTGVDEVSLDTSITEELRLEGFARDVIRAIQGARKEQNLMPGDRITVSLKGPQEIEEVLRLFGAEIKETTGSDQVDIEGESEALEVSIKTL